MNNNLILRTVQSPYGDITLGRVLSHDDVDNNFIYLKGLSIYTASTIGTNLVLSQKNGSSIITDLSQIINTGTTSGGTTGNGTAGYIPKWSGLTNLTNSQMFDDGTNIGVGTASPAFKFDVSGIINTNNGVNISTNGAKTGVYGGANQLNFFIGNANISRFNLVGTVNGLNYYTFDGGFNNSNGATGSQSSIRISSSVVSSLTSNTMNYTQLLINPVYTQTTFGSGDLRGVYYNPIIQSLNTSKHIAWENTSGDIIFGNLDAIPNSYESVLSIGLDGKVIQSTLFRYSTDVSSICIGESIPDPSQFTNGVIIGANAGAGFTSSLDGCVLIGQSAGQNNNAINSTHIGFEAGLNNNGDDTVFIGRQAGQNNTAPKVIAIGKNAGSGNNFDNVIIFGESYPSGANQFTIPTNNGLSTLRILHYLLTDSRDYIAPDHNGYLQVNQADYNTDIAGTTNYQLTDAIVWELTDSVGGGSILLPDPTNFNGCELVLINKSATNDILISNDNTYRPYLQGGSTRVADLKIGKMMILKAINNKWRGGFLADS